MANPKSFWYLRNWQAWVVLAMGIATAFVIQDDRLFPWLVCLGVIGYLVVLLLEVAPGPGNQWAVQENRTLRAEQARLVGGLKELQARVAELEAKNLELSRELERSRAGAVRPPGS